MKMLLLGLALALASCTAPQGAGDITDILVNVSEKRLVAKSGARKIMDVPVETGRRGVGSQRGSKRTPLGEFTIAKKEADHRFGPVMRLDGYQGFKRGILVHRNLDGKPYGTNGCVCPIHYEDYMRLWQMTPVGAKLHIEL